jgi:CYTH domain-containing protein
VRDRHKYARVEWERRFLLDRLPPPANVTRVRRIADSYIDGSNMRLRQQSDDENEPVFKLTQKLPTDATGARQGLITTMYLTEDEFQLLANLPAKMLRKTRYSVPPFGIDVFEDALTGLVLAEAEFNSAEDASALSLPSFIVREVTEDPRFTGGELVRASRQELDKLLAEFQIKM